MKRWQSPDAAVFGPDRPFTDDYDHWDDAMAAREAYQAFVIDNESPDYAG